MTKMDTGAYTGSTVGGNPYFGDLDKGIAYDTYEASAPKIITDRDFPEITSNYRSSAKKTVGYLNVEERARVLELGSGTGIATLELVLQKPGVTVSGVEMSTGMIAIARYKFSQIDNPELLSKAASDSRLLKYWQDFREESAPHSMQVAFIEGDFQEIDSLEEESFQGAIANQFMHWTDLNRSFKQLARYLQYGAECIWNSASHFYDDAQFPVKEFGFRYNDFLKYVLDDVCKQGDYEANDIFSISCHTHNSETLQAIGEYNGFSTTQIATEISNVDLQLYSQNHVPMFVRQLITSRNVNSEELERQIKEAISRAIVNPKAMGDTQHKYEITPYFRSVKR